MWIVATACSSPACDAEKEFVVGSPAEADELVCDCGYCVVSLSFATFEPGQARPGLRLVADPPEGSRELIAA
jgi:hypothetical protein